MNSGLLLSIMFGYLIFMEIHTVNLKQGRWPLDLAVAEVAVGMCGRLNTGRGEEQEAGVET